jgi:intracellular multiplication protein IcmO
MNPFHAATTEPLGGRRETLWMLMVAAGLISAFPPFPGLISHAPSGVGLAVKVGLLAAAAYASYRLAYATQKKMREEFILGSSCAVPSSDPPEVAKGEGGLLIGYSTDDGSPLIIKDDELCRHGVIIGQTGMGKSVLGKTMMFQQIERGGGLLFIDGKLDEDNIQDIYEYAAYCGRANDFIVINPGRPERSNTYNPILFGDPDEVAARIISLIPSTASSAGADYYKQSSNLALVCFISALQEATTAQVKTWIASCKGKGLPEDFVDNNRVTGIAYNFLDLALLTMNEGVLGELLDRVSKSSPESLTRKNLSIFLEQYARENNNNSGQDAPVGSMQIDLKRLKETLGGIGARMHQFGSGRFGPVLNSYSPELKMYDAIKDSKIVYIALPTLGKDVAAQALGKMVVADLRTAISWLQMNKQDRPKIPFLAFMDEMASYAVDTQAIMFEQSRSARVSMWPTLQTDSGLTNVSEDFKERVMANTETKIFFRLSSQATAETASEAIGVTKRLARSSSSSAGTSASAQAMDLGPNKNLSDSSSSGLGEREQEEMLVHADLIKGLEKGECIVLRSPSVWNIRVPMIDLQRETKEAVGPMVINHSKNYTSDDNGFNSIKKVDQFIAQAQARRASKPKKEKSLDAGQSGGRPVVAGNSDTGMDVVALAQKAKAQKQTEAELPFEMD